MDTERRPTVAIMRPQRYQQDSIDICRSAGFDVIPVPMIEILDNRDEHFDMFLFRVLDGQSDYVIFTSANGIYHTLNKVPDRKSFISALNRIRTIAIGPKTAEAAQNAGIRISFIPESYSSEGLVAAMQQDAADKVIDIARSSHGAPVLVEGLKAAGARVFETQVYSIQRPPRNKQQEDLVRALLAGKVDAILFTSSMMVRNLMELCAEMGVKDEANVALKQIKVAAIGQPTANTLNIYKIQVNIVSDIYTFEALIDRIQKEMTPTHE